MINNEEVTLQQHEKLKELMEQIRNVEVKLSHAKDEERNWSRLVTQHTNELNDVKKQAREISNKLFGEEKSKGYPVQDWSPAG